MMPADDSVIDQVFEFTIKLRDLFFRITNGKLLLTANDFERKIHAKPFISKTVALPKVDVRLLFQSATSN